MGLFGSRPRQPSHFQQSGQQQSSSQAEGGERQQQPPPSPSSSYPNWTEGQLLRLISEKKLAPRYALTTTVPLERETECPICFGEYDLNLVCCCQQFICTNCFVTLRKPLDVKCVCPFCEKQGFHVTFAFTDAGDKPNDNAVDCPTSSSSTPYRSRTATPMHIPLSSKADRTALEREISLSRSYDTHDSVRYYGGERGRSNSEQVAPARHRNSNENRRQGPPSSQQEALRELSLMLGDTGEVERLEEIMLMAAIRQSMQEALPPPPPPPTGFGKTNHTGAAPTAAAGAAGGRGGAGEKFGGPPPLPRSLPPAAVTEDTSSQEGGRESGGSLSEEEQMLLAITLSLGTGTGTGTGAEAGGGGGDVQN